MNDYLRNAIGFFIQFFPCAFMIFLPFPQEVCRFRRKRIFIWITVIGYEKHRAFQRDAFINN